MLNCIWHARNRSSRASESQLKKFEEVGTARGEAESAPRYLRGSTAELWRAHEWISEALNASAAKDRRTPACRGSGGAVESYNGRPAPAAKTDRSRDESVRAPRRNAPILRDEKMWKSWHWRSTSRGNAGPPFFIPNNESWLRRTSMAQRESQEPLAPVRPSSRSTLESSLHFGPRTSITTPLRCRGVEFWFHLPLLFEIPKQSRLGECGNPEGISTECGKGGKPRSRIFPLPTLCHLHGLFWQFASETYDKLRHWRNVARLCSPHSLLS